MDAELFRRHGHEMVDWIADYLRDVENYPVLPNISPGQVKQQLPTRPPELGEEMSRIFADFEKIILPGVTHWNHPRFFAYFPANNSGPSILGEMLSAALGVNGMVWQSCPAATELEETVMEWLRQLLTLPPAFRGVIQDTASTSTITAMICAREKTTGRLFNKQGAAVCRTEGLLRIYTSREAHSSVEKGAKIAGFGSDNVVLVDVDESLAMSPADLKEKIAADLTAGYRPCCVVATIGTTSSTAIDPLAAICDVAKANHLWVHIDAALAGSAAILPEKRWLLNGIEGADSFVFNPHKWLFTNFDCSAYFCQDPDFLVSTFSISPEYLKTSVDDRATNFRDWGIPLGRRFRALKLWFVIRHFGAEGLRARLREHLSITQDCRQWIEDHPDFELLAPVPLNTICFRYNPGKTKGKCYSEPELADLNQRLMDHLNQSGLLFMTHTRLGNRFCLRLAIGQTQVRSSHLRQAWAAITDNPVVNDSFQSGE